jgi:hypothetical protein
MFMPLNICLNGNAEDSQRHNHPMVMRKAVNGITI